MPTHQQIRDALVARLNSVPGIGRVHGFERYASEQKPMRDLYLAEGRILGWHVRRGARRAVRVADASYQVQTDWKIRGFLSLDDADQSELIFDGLLDACISALSADPTLGGLVADNTTERAAGAQLVEAGPVMLAGVLCHGAMLELTTVHYQETLADTAALDDLLTVHADYDIAPHTPEHHTAWAGEDHTVTPDAEDSITTPQ
jgi:hypothetical protein